MSDPDDGYTFRPSTGFVAVSLASPLILLGLGLWGWWQAGELRAIPVVLMVLGFGLGAVAVTDVPHAIRLDEVGLHRRCLVRTQTLAWDDLSGLTRSHQTTGRRRRGRSAVPDQPGALAGSDARSGRSGLAAEGWDGRRYLLSMGRERPDTYEAVRSAVARFAPRFVHARARPTTPGRVGPAERLDPIAGCRWRWAGRRSRGRYAGGRSVSESARPMVIALGIIYAIVGLITITLVLLHSGRGGGLSDMFGGGLGASAAGSTQMERNLDRLTVVFGLIFAFLTMVLAFVINA